MPAIATLSQTAFSLLAIYAIFQFVIVPLVWRKARPVPGTMGKPASVALFAAVQLLRSVSLALAAGAILTLTAIYASMLWFDGVEQSSLTVIRLRLDTVRNVRDWVSSINPYISGVVIGALVLALLTVVYRRSRRQADESFKRAQQLELERVLEAREDGNWDKLEPTAEMKTLQDKAEEPLKMLAISDAVEEATRTDDREILDQFDEVPTPEMLRVARERARSQLDLLERLHLQLDAQRRMNVTWHATELEFAPPATWWGRLGTLFVSKGMVNFLGKGQRVLLYVSLLLLIPAHVALTAPLIGNALDVREVRLNDIAVSLNAKEAEDSLQRTLTAQSSPAQALTQDDEHAIDGLSHAFERGYVRSVAIRSGVPQALVSSRPVRGTTFQSVSSDQARREVIEAVEKQRGLSPVTGATRTDALPDLHREALMFSDAGERAGAAPSPVRRLAEQDLRQAAQRSPELRQRMREAWKGAAASFQTLDTASGLKARLFANLVAPVGNVDSELGREIARIGAGLDDAAAKGWQQRAFKTQMSEFITTLHAGGNVDAAMARVAEGVGHAPIYTRSELGRMQNVMSRVPDESAVVRAFEQHQLNVPPPGFQSPPAGAPRPGMPMGGGTRADALLQEMGSKIYVSRAMPETFGNALAGFSDYFPAHKAEASATRMAATRLATGAAIRSSMLATSEARRAAAAITTAAAARDGAKLADMSRSFVKLSGFRRVGGVLIGRDPEPGAGGLDFRDLTWTIANNRVKLDVRRADGKLISLGPYSANIVLPALGYAADQRATTVTMVKADPLLELKVLAHPVLEDTPLGCRAIEIDRFVDTASAETKDISDRDQRTLERITQAQIVYDETRRIAIAETDLTLVDRQVVDLLRKSAGASASQEALAKALSGKTELLDPKWTPLSEKPAFFDRSIVDVMRACLGADSPEKYRACAIQDVRKARLPIHGSMAWSAPTPIIERWSGVRERAYVLDPQLEFAGAGYVQKPNDTWPIDFIIQASFGSPAFAVARSRAWYMMDNSEVEDHIDAKPWIFQVLQTDLPRQIAQMMARKPEWADTFHSVREFVVVQRLFRSALAGDLGARFPVEKLGALARDIAPLTRRDRTVRWNIRPGMLEQEFGVFIASRKSNLLPHQKLAPLRTQIDACLAEMSRSPQRDRMPQDRWDKACNFEPLGTLLSAPGMEDPAALPLLSEVIEASTKVSYARQIRRELGLEEEATWQQSGDARCKPM